MTKILWLSRHTMTEGQLADLKRIYGEVEVKTCDQTVNGWKDVVEAGEDCEVLAVVLPPSILMDLTNPRNNTKPVLRAIANRIATGKTVVNPATGKEEQEFKFEHAGWEQIEEIIIKAKKL